MNRQEANKALELLHPERAEIGEAPIILEGKCWRRDRTLISLEAGHYTAADLRSFAAIMELVEDE